jgi:hypothetical protein
VLVTIFLPRGIIGLLRRRRKVAPPAQQEREQPA